MFDYIVIGLKNMKNIKIIVSLKKVKNAITS